MHKPEKREEKRGKRKNNDDNNYCGSTNTFKFYICSFAAFRRLHKHKHEYKHKHDKFNEAPWNRWSWTERMNEQGNTLVIYVFYALIFQH